MLETAHHQAHCRGQADQDDGEADHHGHLDVHLHHAVDVSDRAAGRPTADGVVQRIISSGTLEIFLKFYLQLLWRLMPLIPPRKLKTKIKLNQIRSVSNQCEIKEKLK